MALIQDTVIWAQQHGIPTPGFTANGETTVEATIRGIIKAEQAFLRQFGLMIQARAQGLLLPEDIVRYDSAREQLYNSQKEFYQEYTSGRVWHALNALGAVRDIPAPQKAPAFSTFMGVGVGAQVRGLAGDPVTVTAAGIAGVSWGAIVFGVVVIVAALAITGIALASAFEAEVNADQHSLTIRERVAAYTACMTSGGNAEECAGVAATVAPSMGPPPGAEDPLWFTRLKGAAKYVGIALGVGAVGYLAVKLISKRIDNGPALRGLPSGSFAGARFPVQRASTRRTSRGRNLAGRGTKRGKRGLRGGDYNMEVQ